ncbi:MAG: DJ-1/PfpI family protein [Tenericutes bacterium]|nr:DJ-1/PfpI family protein [Mycoplasmatota bacterium]
MNIALFYYDDFVEFEIALALFLLRDEKIIHFSLEKKNYQSYEGQTFIPEFQMNEVSPKSVDLLIIPGGNSLPLFKNEPLKKWIKECVENGGKIAGICGGAELLAGLGFLKGRICTAGTSGLKSDDPIYGYFSECKISNSVVEIDGPFITSQGQGYAEFAAKLYHLSIGGEKPESEMSILKWLKNDRT